MKRLEYEELRRLGLSERALDIYSNSEYDVKEVDGGYEISMNGDFVTICKNGREINDFFLSHLEREVNGVWFSQLEDEIV